MKRELIRGNIWLRIDTSNGPDSCWIWRGSLSSNGYGQVRINGKMKAVHRLAYEEKHGPIPEGKELDHLCRTRPCANPSHLEAVSHRENTLRGETITQRAAARTHCPQGHDYAVHGRVTKDGDRKCRICQAEYTKRWHAARRDLSPAADAAEGGKG